MSAAARKTFWTTALLLLWALLIVVPVAPARGASQPFSPFCPPVNGQLVGYGCTDLSLASQEVRLKLVQMAADPPEGGWPEPLASLVRTAGSQRLLSIARLSGSGLLVIGYSSAKGHAEASILRQMRGQEDWVVWDPATKSIKVLPRGTFTIERIYVDLEPCDTRPNQCESKLLAAGISASQIEYSWLWNVRHWPQILAALNADLSSAVAKLGVLTPAEQKDMVHHIANAAGTGLKTQAVEELYRRGTAGYVKDAPASTAVNGAISLITAQRKKKEDAKNRSATPTSTPTGDEDSGGAAPTEPGPKDNGPAGGAADPGGIDFASVELRYVSGAGGGSYAFRAPTTPGKGSTDGVGAVLTSLNAVQVWLAVEPSKFWVNLNPNEPDRIIDPVLGVTDAGRILLDADLTLKEAGTKLVDPNTKLGKRFWKKLTAAHVESFCTRNWIVPGTAAVHASDEELYILDAPLKVESEGDYFSLPGSKQEICPADSTKGAGIYKSLIVPALTDLVNDAPAFRDLRQVYYARVVAEWYRQRAAADGDSDERGIDSNDVTTLETSRDWVPKTVFDKYVKEINATTYRAADGFTVTSGGVDFSQPVTWSSLDEATFGTRYAELPAVVRESVSDVATAGDGKTAYIGGGLTPETTVTPVTSPAPLVPEVFAAPEARKDRHPIRSTLIVSGVSLLVLLAWWRIRVVNRQISRSRRTG